jgi:4-hydroxy-tetrahydrodipicolinate synthase
MNWQSKFSGTGVAIVTPFKADSSIDWEALSRVIEHVLQPNGVDYIVSLGTTGEAITISTADCKTIFEFTKKQVNGRVPLVAGLFGSNNTATIVDRFAAYATALEGFDAILSSSPGYNKPSQEGIYQHYLQVAAASPLPIIIYNVPGRTGSNVSAKTICRLAHASEKFIAVKEASGNMVQGMEIIKHKPNHFMLLSGDDPTVLPLIAAGGQGVISVIANAYPVTFSTMVRKALEGDYATARKLNTQLLDIHHWLYVENNPCGIKAALNVMGLCENSVRLPLVPQTGANYEHLLAEMQTVNLKA